VRVKVYYDVAGGEFHFVDADNHNADWPTTWEFRGYAEFPLFDADGNEQPKS
jgi:hypothetical protein